MPNSWLTMLVICVFYYFPWPFSSFILILGELMLAEPSSFLPPYPAATQRSIIPRIMTVFHSKAETLLKDSKICPIYNQSYMFAGQLCILYYIWYIVWWVRNQNFRKDAIFTWGLICYITNLVVIWNYLWLHNHHTIYSGYNFVSHFFALYKMAEAPTCNGFWLDLCQIV